MNGEDADKWTEANQRYLASSLEAVRIKLEEFIRRGKGDTSSECNGNAGERSLDRPVVSMSSPPALEVLCAIFGLSPFERDLLLLCAGTELDSRFAQLCANAQDNPQKTYPTFSLALSVFPDAHWSAITPCSPLRKWKLMEVGPGSVLTTSPLKIDERVLHFLAGVQHLDERLTGFMRPIFATDDLVQSHLMVAEEIASLWSDRNPDGRVPIIQISGRETQERRAIASHACSILGMSLYEVPAANIPLDPSEQEALIRLWEREALLGGSALLVECGEMNTSDAAREAAISQFTENIGGVVLIGGCARRSLPDITVITFEVPIPTPEERRNAWIDILSEEKVQKNLLELVISQFDMSRSDMYAAYLRAWGSYMGGVDATEGSFSEALWRSCRDQSRPRLENLARRIDPVATWDELVLPDAQLQLLREVAIHVRNSVKVYEDWGFAAKSSQGLGINALFTGGSGTGKTMAAEVLANELSLDLYRIDLSQIVSKYIGETEKNLRNVFDAAEDSGAILLFDEADALFGKRSEVKDSHDRHANIEVSYLLQRMENYRGLAILTTNMKEALDTAFMRRIRFIVRFPFPDADQRRDIWERIFPEQMPTEGLDTRKLARLTVAGGNIRNIALYAAFLAAEEGEPVKMKHLERAARVEYAKMERPLTDAEIGRWK